MTNEVKQPAEALLEWAKQDKNNRAVIVIAYERGKVTEATTEADVLFGQAGRHDRLKAVLKSVLAADGKAFANLVKEAVHELALDALLDKLHGQIDEIIAKLDDENSDNPKNSANDE